MAFDGSTIATATTATLVSFTYSDTFSIGLTGDVDMVAITLLAGRSYSIDIDNGAAGDLYLRVFDAFGSEVRANDDGFRTDDDVVFSLSPYIEFSPNYTGTYYVAASTYFLQGYDPLTTFGRSPSVENPIGIIAGTLTIFDNGNNTWPFEGSINAITLESSSDETDALRDEGRSHRVQYIGNLEDGFDVDMARMDLTKGDVVVVDVNGLNGNSTTIRVFNPSNTQIGIDDLAGAASDPELIFGAPSAGAYYVAISGDGNASYNPADGTGTLSSPFSGEFEVIVHLNPTLIGTNSAQLISGDSVSDYAVGLAGNDTQYGYDGNDTLAGGDDNDSLFGGNGRDILYGEQGNDRVAGDRGQDVLTGGLGNDTLNGGANEDLLQGGTGDDSLIGGSENDTMQGDAGADALLGNAGDDLLNGGAGLDNLRGEAGADTLLGENDADTLLGFDGNDQMFGGNGDDSLNGGNDADLMDGGTGNDFLTAGAGLDTLTGGQGNDTLTGGADADTFVFASTGDGVDTITTLSRLTGDVIDLRLLFGAGVVNAGNLAQYVQTSTSGISDSFLAVDADGLTGGLSFTIIAQVNGLTAAQLFDTTSFLL